LAYLGPCLHLLQLLLQPLPLLRQTLRLALHRLGGLHRALRIIEALLQKGTFLPFLVQLIVGCPKLG
jgi:hypothetical protein